MKERVKFEKVLNDYYKHLIIRFNRGADYIDQHNDDTKGIKEWKLIKEELKLIESMIILYEEWYYEKYKSRGIKWNIKKHEIWLNGEDFAHSQYVTSVILDNVYKNLNEWLKREEYYMKNTLVVNLFGGPGCGKSTLMAAIFHQLKLNGYDCEMVTEFAKDLVWEKRNETFKDELYIFAKQNHRLFRVNGKVDIIVTDRPLLLTNAYNQDDKELCSLCLKIFNQYNNLNFLLKRQTVYQENGRNQSEEEAMEIDKITQDLLESNGIDHYIVNNDDLDDIIKIIKSYID